MKSWFDISVNVQTFVKKRGEKQVEFLSRHKKILYMSEGWNDTKGQVESSQECKCAAITMGFRFPGEYNVTVSFFIFINTSPSVSVITILN